MKRSIAIAAALGLCAAGFAQNKSYNVNAIFKGAMDASGATYARPFVTQSSDPAGACTNAAAWVENTTTGQLSYCLSGTWTKLNSALFGFTPEPAITAGTSSQYWRGDKTWQALNAAAVTNAVDSTNTYANPAWLTSLAWVKLTGVPSTFTPSAHASSHLSSGTDPIAAATSSVRGTVTTTTSTSQVVSTDDSRVTGAVQQGSSGNTLPNTSLGSGYLSSTKTAGVGGVTAGHAVKIDSSTPANTVVECSLSDVEFLGIAVSTAAQGVSVEIATRGVVQAMADGSTTIGHVAGTGSVSAGRIADLGQTGTSSVSISRKVIGKWLETKTAGQLGALQLYGPGHFGAQVQAADLPSHASSHASAGSDPVTPAAIGAQPAIAGISTLPAASSAVVDKVYRWIGATSANLCPAAGAGGSGGSATALCITHDGTSWRAVLETDGSGNVAVSGSGSQLATLNTTGTSGPLVTFNIGGSEQAYIGRDGGVLTVGASQDDLTVRNNGTGLIRLNHSGTTNVVVDSGGNVGIGTTSPATALTVSTTSTSSPRGIMSAQYSTDTNGARLGFRKARGTEGSPTTVVSGDNLGRLNAWPYDGTSYLEMASIIFQTEGTIATNRTPTNIQFWTATNAGPSVLTERMRIDSAGNVGIGTTSPQAKLDINGTVSNANLPTSCAGQPTGMVWSNGGVWSVCP